MARRKHGRSLQFATSGNLILPGDRPDIEFLLRVTSTPIIEQCVVSSRQIHIIGHIKVFTEYVASVHDGTQPVAFVVFMLPFDETFAHHHARAGMNACLRCAISTQHLQLSNPKELAMSLNVKILGVKLTRSCSSLPPHLCMPCIVNLFETGNPGAVMPTYE